jgi:hypothetical protein
MTATTSPTSPAPAPGWGNPTTPNPQWGRQQPPSPPTPPTPPAPVARKRPGWARRNLATLLAGAALAFSLIGLVTGPQGPAGPPGPQGPQGVQGKRGPAGPAGKDATAPAPAPAPEPAPAPGPAPAPAPAPAAEFGEGVYKVGTDIQPGEYKADVPAGGHGYWARLSSSNNSDIIANDLKDSGTMYLRVEPSDKFIEISGVTFHKVG